MDRICLFIDGSNFYYQLKEYDPRLKIDYGKLAETLAGKKRKLIRAYYYIPPPIDQDQHRFSSYLQNIPYFQVRFGRLEQRGDNYVEKGTDVKLAVDMVALAFVNAYDVAVLVSNDADLEPAVEMVKQLGKQVEYAYLLSKTVILAEVCDISVPMDATFLAKAKI
ncbi:MAG: NYN domain-containing protein [Candidatus Omnitrophota bacterium]|jgi:uncharacterized LabA/DUF88 family protein|nr:MAG: NYN domain-containing protein [Candidatus Omnitrophota bacterium]